MQSKTISIPHTNFFLHSMEDAIQRPVNEPYRSWRFRNASLRRHPETPALFPNRRATPSPMLPLQFGGYPANDCEAGGPSQRR